MATLLYQSQYFTTTLSVSGGIDDSQTTGIVLQAVTGVSEPTKPGLCLLSYSDPLSTTAAEWITYNSVNTTTKELVGVSRAQEGSSGKAHGDGVAVAFPHSMAHINRINDKLTGADTGVVLDDVDLHGTPTFDSEALSVVYPGSLSRQAIMNGNFDVWQRGTSVSVTDAAIIRLADRWFDYVNKDSGTLPTLTRSQQALTAGDIPNAFYFTRLATNGAGTSLGVNSQGGYFQRIEHGTRLLCGASKKVTISFYAKSDITNKRICPTLQQNYGTGGSPSSAEYILGTPITLTTTWTKYTATFTTNTLVGKTFGTANDDYLQVNLFYMWGTTLGNSQVQASVTAETFVGSGNIDIAQVQLCAGDVALPFQPKSYGEEERGCKRYFYRMKLGSAYDFMPVYGYTVNTTTAYLTTHLQTEMRTYPTASYSGSIGIKDMAGGFTAISALSSSASSPNMANLTATSTGVTANRFCTLQGNNDANAYIDLSSEL